MNPNPNPPSWSVNQVMSQFSHTDSISASRLASAMLSFHTYYGKPATENLMLRDTPTRKTVDEWYQDVASLFDWEKVQGFSKKNEPVQLHGRQLVLGLCLLEPDLRTQFEEVGAFDAIRQELFEPLDEILNSEGLELLYATAEAAPDADTFSSQIEMKNEYVAPQEDDPVESEDGDKLGRRYFAAFLAKRLSNVFPTHRSRKEKKLKSDGAYGVHLYGAWGSGKSSVLHLLEKEFRSDKEHRWIVIWFNAWQNQQITPAWYVLIDKICKGTRAQLKMFARIREDLWRLVAGLDGPWRLVRLLSTSLLIYVIGFFIFMLFTGYYDIHEDLKQTLGIIVGGFTGIFGIYKSFRSSILSGGAQSAAELTKTTRDPMFRIQHRFNRIIYRLRKYRICIYIDDLDRCGSQYVVDLLEGVQTIFHEAPILYVVTADRKWLYSCYEQIYAPFKEKVNEPGKSLGGLFLEKVFQHSTPLPGISDETKGKFWNHVLNPGYSPEVDQDKLREYAKSVVSNLKTDEEIQSVLRDTNMFDTAEQQAIREQAVVQLATPSIEQDIEHRLAGYTEYIKPNPRSMKLLVNAYSNNRALSILVAAKLNIDQLMRWTILRSRWPQLAEYLTEHPDMVEHIGESRLSSVPPDLRPLFADNTITKLLKDQNQGTNHLTHAHLVQCKLFI